MSGLLKTLLSGSVNSKYRRISSFSQGFEWNQSNNCYSSGLSRNCCFCGTDLGRREEEVHNLINGPVVCLLVTRCSATSMSIFVWGKITEVNNVCEVRVGSGVSVSGGVWVCLYLSFCFLWINKEWSKDKTYIWVSVRWKTKKKSWGIYTSHLHWVDRGTGTPKDKDEVCRHDVSDCDVWDCLRKEPQSFYYC
jgi:hypothetical protein